MKLEKTIGKAAIELLATVIGLGGGFSLRPRIENYWFLNYKPGIYFELDNNDLDGEIKQIISDVWRLLGLPRNAFQSILQK